MLLRSTRSSVALALFLIAALVPLGAARSLGQAAREPDPTQANFIFATAIQPDGKIVAGGLFATIAGPGVASHVSLARFNPDGSLDASFDPGADAVSSLAIQPDGRILVAGGLTRLGGGGRGVTPRSYIARINANGSLDATFDPGANAFVAAMTLQADGRILVGGDFTMLGGGGTGTAPRSRIGRINSNGSIDTTFDPGADGTVQAVAVQADGKILVGGNFTTLGGGANGKTPRSHIGRLNRDGSLDASFDPGANGHVLAFAVQPDGRILVGGDLTMLGGGGTGKSARSRIARLNPDGSLDATFDPGANGLVDAFAVQPDGKIVVGGSFRMLGGGGTGTADHSRIGRLNPDGSLDAAFDLDANERVDTLALQPDGKIVVGGDFGSFGSGATLAGVRLRIVRLNGDGTIDMTFRPQGMGFLRRILPEPPPRFSTPGR